ncbi:MAG: hypothetical protein OSB19_13485 [Opitutaceae bacterium]|nr:hypothetical protein [Opitutaceae bacterium]
MNKRTIFALAAATQFAIMPFVFAQEAEEEEVFELSPFSVDSSKDTGYRATNTLSGTRFNSSLRDTSASISVWTEEFLEDTGLTEIDELIQYSLNTVLDTADQDGAGGNFNVFTNATAVTQRIRTRGIESSRGIDYFKSIVPDDSYKIGRYDDSRGPNGVLFGVSAAGGIINQSSIVANTQRNSGRIRVSFGTNDRKRAEFRLNRVLVEGKLALTVAALSQENGHWRDFISDDKNRIFGAMTWKVNDKITLRANYEDGFHHKTSIQQSPITDRVLPWYDNMLVSGVDAVTFKPNGKNPKKAQRLVGVVARDGNGRFSNKNPLGASNGSNRFTFIENDGTFYNAAGTYNTGGYDDERVAHPDGTPGLGDRVHRINDQDFLPYHFNPGGPDFYRETDLSSHSFFADIQLTENWFFNIQAGHQRADIDVPQLQGTRPEFRADPNTTQGVNGPANPYAGQFYFDGDYRRDKNLSRYDEIRVSTSYNLTTERVGNHRFAIAVSSVDEEQLRGNTNFGLAGNPSKNGNFTDVNGFIHREASFHHANNRVTIRNYFDPNDRATWTAGSWRNVPDEILTDRWSPGEPQLYKTVFAEAAPGNINYLINQVTDSMMAVTQSHLLNNKFVVTLGYREDTIELDRAGHRLDPVIGWLPDFGITPDTPSSQGIAPAAPSTHHDAVVRTAGAVYHLNGTFSLVANTGSNIGIPDFRRTVFPGGATGPPADGDGSDFGIDFTLMNNRISGRLVYYETESIQEVVGGSQLANPVENAFEAYETAFTPAVDGDGVDVPGTGNRAALESLLTRRQELRPETNGYFRDNKSNGFELRLTANMTENWRLTLNAAKTDRIVSNSFGKGVAFTGLMEAGDGLVIQGATEASEVDDPDDPGSTIQGYTIDRSAYTSDGVISKYLDLADQLPANRTLDNTSVSRLIFDMADAVNERREIMEKRWGLRPYRFNVFTAYDFNQGRMKGISVGGGYRWTSPNIIGEEDGVEFEGKAKMNADFFIRYKVKNNFLGDGNWTYQMNVINLFDNRTIIPSRLAIDGNIDYQIPGDRGIAYAKFDLPTPRQFRFTVTKDF